MNRKKLEYEYIKILDEIKVLKAENLEIKKTLRTIGLDRNVMANIHKIEKEKEELQREKLTLQREIDKLNKKLKKKKRRNSVKTTEYKIFRESILKRDNYRCVECGDTHRLQVHHIKPKSKYPELLMVPSNCVTLCISCHSKTDNFFTN